MGTYPHALRCDVSQYRVERGAVAPVSNGIDPNEHAINADELRVNFVNNVVAVDGRLGGETYFFERSEDRTQSRIRHRRQRRKAVATEKHSDSTRGHLGPRVDAASRY